jgi:hypothetical protein
MAQIGLPSSGNAAPSTGFFHDDTGNSQYWSGVYTLPAGGGIVTDLFVYVNGDLTTATARLCIWGSGGTLLYQSGNITLPSGTQTIGGQSWQHVTPNVYFNGGNYNFGLWTSGNVVWTYEASGAVNFQRSLASAPANLSSGGTDGSGSLGAYIVYTPGGVGKIWNGTSWVDPAIGKVWNGTSWIQANPQIWNGTSWVSIT